jgi:hypothetical protein
MTVALNGTTTNPYKALYQIKSNPFPQIAESHYVWRCLRMQELGGEPIPHDHYQSYIREKLEGFSTEFIALCIQKFRAGEYIKFDVFFPSTYSE